VVFTASGLTVGLSATVPTEHDDRDVTAEFTLAGGQSAVFALDEVSGRGAPRPCSAEQALSVIPGFWPSPESGDDLSPSRQPIWMRCSTSSAETPCQRLIR
jgi:hypothetical protein